MITKQVDVTLTVQVTVDEAKFTDQFLRQFVDSFYPYDTLDKHVMHLAQLAARGLYNLSPHDRDEFIEGYGPAGDMGLSAVIVGQEEEIL